MSSDESVYSVEDNDDYFEDEGDSAEIYGADDSEPDETVSEADDDVNESYEEEEETFDVKTVSEFNKEIIILRPENRQTSNCVTRFEAANITSIRATQIEQYNNCFVDTTGLDTAIEMARREFNMRMCPLLIQRHVGDVTDKKTGEVTSYYEYIDPNTAAHSPF